MRRFVALMLVAVTVLLLASCGGTSHSELTVFSDALSGAGVHTAEITTSASNDTLSLSAQYTVTYNDAMTAEIEYTRQTANEIDPDNLDGSETVSTVTGNATVDAEGNTVSGSVGALVASVVALELTLDGDVMTYTVDAQTLTATVAAQYTESVFGVDIGEDAVVCIVLSDGVLSSIEITYSTVDTECKLACEFNK